VLLLDALEGRSANFTREDSVEEEWRVMQPLLDRPPEVHMYEPGTWGPAAADTLLAGDGRWHDPWIGS
jgi:glucose-6-phosphate 1-dehydrogenase